MGDPQYLLKQWLADKLQPRGAKASLSKHTGIAPDKITRSIALDTADPKKRRSIRIDEIEAIARFFNALPPGFEGMERWLAPARKGQASEHVRVVHPAPGAPSWRQRSGEGYIAILGQTPDGPNGRFMLGDQEVGRVFLPPKLEGVEGAYAVRVFGTSMEPRFKAGETIWLDPNEPVRAGDDVVVQLRAGGVEGQESYIKEFRSRSRRVLRLWQHNPDEAETCELEFDERSVLAVHKVVYHAML